MDSGYDLASGWILMCCASILQVTARMCARGTCALDVTCRAHTTRSARAYHTCIHARTQMVCVVIQLAVPAPLPEQSDVRAKTADVMD